MDANWTGYALSVPQCEHSPLRKHINKVETAICPQCRKDRPLDWFNGEKRCWKCRSINPKEA